MYTEGLPFIILGTILLAFVFFDILSSVTGEGSKFTMKVSKGYYKAFIGVFGLLRQRRRHYYIGLLVIITNIVVWVLCLWAGWALLFLSQDGTVTNTNPEIAVGTVDIIYFTGYTVFTLGIGDFQPTSGIWQLLTALASLSGLFLITLLITFLTPIVQAVFLKKKISLQIYYLGETSSHIIKRAANQENISSLNTQFALIAGDITELNQKVASYPVIHYFHGSQRKEEFSLALCTLYETIIVLREVCTGDTLEFDQSILNLLERIIDDFLDSAKLAIPIYDHIVPKKSSTLQDLRREGYLSESVEDILKGITISSEHKKVLLSMIYASGWPSQKKVVEQ